MENFSLFIALLVLLLLISTTPCLCTKIFDSSTDKQALIAFKAFITSDPHAILSKNWTADTPVCDWTGVSCGMKHHRVTALNLSGFGLVGTIAPHLGNLTFLRYLSIYFNSFTGFLPSELSNLHRLKVMNVGENKFSGEIPAWLGSLMKLETLQLFNNNFSGGVPSEIGNLSSLKVLGMGGGASLTGNIPSSIFNISSLKALGIFNNSLSGSIPTFHKLTQLERLHLYNTKVTGWLPSDICNSIPNIKELLLFGNQLNGPIPTSIWNCTYLEVLDLSNNNFEGVPSEIGNLSSLKVLGMGGSASLTGNIPSSIFNISSLKALGIFNNSLSGSIPTFFKLTQLEKLYLYDTKVTGIYIL